jgi:hypothetical protein
VKLILGILVVDPLPKAILSSYKFIKIELLLLIEPGELIVLINFFSLIAFLSSAIY